VGFALTVSSITVTAVNTVPLHYTGMASAATSLLRDFGFTLGPAIVGAVALGGAASEFNTKLAASSLAPQVKAAAQQVAQQGGPLAINSVPPDSPPRAAASLAFNALGHGYAVGYIVCGVAALVSCVLTVLWLRGRRDDSLDDAFAEDSRHRDDPIEVNA
jgi:hypothetical protein